MVPPTDIWIPRLPGGPRPAERSRGGDASNSQWPAFSQHPRPPLWTLLLLAPCHQCGIKWRTSQPGVQPLYRRLPLCHCWVSCLCSRGATTLFFWGNNAIKVPNTLISKLKHTNDFLSNFDSNCALSFIFHIPPGVSEQRICYSKPPVSSRGLLSPHYWPPHWQTVWHQVLQVRQDHPVPQPGPLPIQEHLGCAVSPAADYTCVSGVGIHPF